MFATLAANVDDLPTQAETQPDADLSRAGRAAFWLAAGVLFALAFSQAPLFTYNQNTKLLHGMAAGGWGDLRGDWLVNTPDPFPVFGGLVRLVTELGHPKIVHFLYAAILGVYLYGGWTVADWLTSDSTTPRRRRRWLFVALMTVAHAISVRELWDGLGVNFAGFPPGLAEQFLLGPVFEPAVFGALFPLSVGLFLKGKPVAAAVLPAVAATLHPTYLLGAAVLTLTYAAWWLRPASRDGRKALLSVAAFLAVAGPFAIYFAVKFGGVDPQVARQADDILIRFRIPHHSLPTLFLWRPEVPFVLIVVVAGIWLSRGPLRFVILWPSLATIALTLLAAVLGPTVLNLIAPWRMSTFLVPLALIALLARAADALARVAARPKARRIIAAVALTLVLVVAADGTRIFFRNYKRQARQNHAAVIRYVAAHRVAGEQYAVPTWMADFRLRSGAATFVTSKSHPIAGRPVLAWYDRVRDADALYAGDAAAARRVAAAGVTHAVVDVIDEATALAALRAAAPSARVVYRDKHFLLVALDAASPPALPE